MHLNTVPIYGFTLTQWIDGMANVITCNSDNAYLLLRTAYLSLQPQLHRC